MKPTSPEIVSQIQTLKSAGMSIRNIQKALLEQGEKVSIGAISKILKDYPACSNTVAEESPECSSPEVITDVEDAEQVEPEDCKHQWVYLDHQGNKRCQLCNERGRL